MKLLEALRRRGLRIAGELEESKLLEHMGDRGRFREVVIRDFLRPFLPPSYGLSSGEIFSGEGEQSAQIDIIIYDAVFSTVLFQDKPDLLFPAESVFGSIEVKSHLSPDELDVACSSVRSVKSLKRLPSDMLDLLPATRLNVGAGLYADSSIRNPYVGFIWAFQGCSMEAAANALSQMLRKATTPAERQLLPDGVFVWKQGYVIIRMAHNPGQGKHYRCGPGMDLTDFASLKVGEDVLPLFFLMLNTCLGHLRLKAVDTDVIFDRVFRSYLGPSDVTRESSCGFPPMLRIAIPRRQKQHPPMRSASSAFKRKCGIRWHKKSATKPIVVQWRESETGPLSITNRCQAHPR
jgi:hypothetical protein